MVLRLYRSFNQAKTAVIYNGKMDSDNQENVFWKFESETETAVV